MPLADGQTTLRPLTRCLVLLTIAFAAAAPRVVMGQTPGLTWSGSFEVMTSPSTSSPLLPAQPANGPSVMSRRPISADGRWVVYSTQATNLGLGPGIYRRERRTGTTQNLVQGTTARNPAISADGNHLVFELCQTICQIYAKDLRGTAPSVVMSASTSGSLGNGESLDPVVSANGRFVVFSTKAINLAPNFTPLRQVVLRDRDTDGNGIYDEPGTVLLQTVSQPHQITNGWGNGDSDIGEVSDDGRYVAFRSLAPNLVSGDTNGTSDVFLRDRVTSQTRRINVRADGSESWGPIVEAKLSISGDGRYVAFASGDSLVNGPVLDTNGTLDVFVHDRVTSTLSRLDLGGVPGNPAIGNGPTGWPTLSADGRYVSVQSAATNMPLPPHTGVHVYTVDRSDSRVSWITGRFGLTPGNQPGVNPAISPDGSVVLFWSTATNLAPIMTAPSSPQLQAAASATIGPNFVYVPAPGGTATFDVTAQAQTRWQASWSNQPWVTATSPLAGVGSASLTFNVHQENTLASSRSTSVGVASWFVTLTQEAAVSLTAASPSAGPMSGGTQVTLTGTGFVPGTVAHVGGSAAPTQYINSTTLVATTPPSPTRQAVLIGVVTPDGRGAGLDGGFFYLDDTPPALSGTAAGPLGENGWFTGDVTVSWVWADDETAVTGTCVPTVITQDTAGTTVSCTVSSEGGSTTASVVVKRDTMPPAITITSPKTRQLVPAGSALQFTFNCVDTVSGMAGCGLAAPSGVFLDTSMPGWHLASTSARDAAGNLATASVEYAVDSAACTPYPEGLQSWYPLSHLSDHHSWDTWGQDAGSGQTFVTGMVDQALSFATRSSGVLLISHEGRLTFSSALSVSAWLKPASPASRLITHDQFLLDRDASGAVTWTIVRPNGEAAIVGTSSAAVLPSGFWSHLTFTYDGGDVSLYVNGRLAETWTQVAPNLVAVPADRRSISVGGPGVIGTGFYVGLLDELQFYDRALDPADVERLFLAGSAGACWPADTGLSVEPSSPEWGAGTYHVRARLTRQNGTPLEGLLVNLRSNVRPGPADPQPTISLVTDGAGEVHWDAPFSTEPGTYAVEARFEGTPQHRFVSRYENVVVRKAVPQLTWATPAPITYGTPLGAAQETVTANVAGSFNYSLRGRVLSAGSHLISAGFSATDYLHYSPTAATTTIEVLKAVPAMTATAATRTYNTLAQYIAVSVTDYAGRPLSGYTITYNGSTWAPSDVGVYEVVATFAGDANHQSRSVTTTLTITPATPTMGFSWPSTFAYDGQPHPLTATVTGALSTPLGTAPVTYNGLPAPPVNAGSYAVSATFAGNPNYVSRTIASTMTITPATPVVTVSGGPFSYDAQPHAATVTVNGIGGEVPPGSVAITYNGAPGVPVGAGSYVVQAQVAASGNYTAASGSGTLIVGKAAASVSVVSVTATYNGQPHSAPATATGGGGTTVGPVVVTYNGGSTVPIAAGTYDVIASFAGDANHEPTSTSGTLVIAKAAPALTWNVPAPIVYGASLSATQLNATASVAGTFGYAPAAGTVLEATPSHTLTATFMPSDPTNYEAGTVSTTIAVLKSVPTLSVTGGWFGYDGQPHAASASVIGVGGVSLGPLAITYSGGTAVPSSAGTYEVFATYAGDVNYEPASGSATITIDKAPVTLSWAAPAPIGYGTPLSAAQLNATANVPGTFSYSPAAGTVLGPGSRSLSATFTPADGQNYNGATVTTTIFVERALATVSVTGGTFAYDGQPHLATAAATGAGGIALTSVSVTYNGSSAAPVAAGTYSVVATFAGDANHEPSTGTATIVVVAAPLTVRTNDAVKAYGVAVPGFTASFTGLVGGDTPASLGGALGFATAATSSSPVGTYAVTPAGLSSSNYAIMFASGTLSIVKAPVTVTVTASPTPSGLDMPITFTATVAAAEAAPTAPAGTIRFFDGATLLGTATLSGGTATLLTGGITAGSHTIEARFDGDASFDVGTRTATHVVNTAAATPAITITSSRQPASVGQSVTLTATITVATSGTIAFYDGGTLLGSGSIAAGRATLTTSTLAAGSHAIIARFQGTASAPPVISPVFVQAITSGGWKDRTSSVALVSSANPSALGTTVTFTATASGSSGTPTGRILFLADGLVVGDPTGVAITAGQASVQVPSLNGGRHTVTATYLGNSNYRGSNGALTQTVN